MKILRITSPDICNGLGNRVTLWVAGCSHHCPGCHNEHAWNYNIGTDISIDENYNKVFNIICKELDRNIITGLTISGGDPLDQQYDRLLILLKFVKEIKEKYPNKDIWIYNGDTYENTINNELKSKIVSYCDVMVDGPFIIDKKDTTIPFRGSTNQRVIDLKHSSLNNISILL